MMNTNCSASGRILALCSYHQMLRSTDATATTALRWRELGVQLGQYSLDLMPNDDDRSAYFWQLSVAAHRRADAIRRRLEARRPGCSSLAI